MRNRWVQAGVVGMILASITVVAVGLLSGGRDDRNRAYELEQQLRCPVCTSVSIAESMSETAQAMRRSVADQIAAGRTDQQILDYFRSRYGEWVVLDPPVRGNTLLVWLLPVLAGAAGAAVLLLRPRSSRTAPERLSTDRRHQVAREMTRVRADPAEEDP